MEEEFDREQYLTREDVLRMIEECGGLVDALDLPKNNLDLSNKIFQNSINLSNVDLPGVNFENAIFAPEVFISEKSSSGANLTNTNLSNANLKRAILHGAKLINTNLTSANLRGTVFEHASFDGVSLYEAQINSETRLENVKWFSYVLGEEKNQRWADAEATYRKLKLWYQNAGMYSLAGEFFYREMSVHRKALQQGDFFAITIQDAFQKHSLRTFWLAIKIRKPLPWTWSMIVNILCGYGERPLRAIISGLVIVLGLGSIYIAGTSSIDLAYYFSLVSFTAIGYGEWIDSSSVATWVKALGAIEAVTGVFMMALFLTTFTRKMSR